MDFYGAVAKRGGAGESKVAIAKDLGVSRATLYRALGRVTKVVSASTGSPPAELISDCPVDTRKPCPGCRPQKRCSAAVHCGIFWPRG
ncbi:MULTISPECIES: helix-turn-helix domain-containing protein [Corynebacterium]|uniref:helix-turn-helix domain-containing protein n=1 Tax=Corynebacterium TaxID=1716 RepID=UPI0021AFCC67|nr:MULTISPECIES: helix-turn-helix domain-containing protein [Corynebacterium]WNI14055.1 helix-turn-helix domain-containing protein [Corynebacterium sp. Z-1]